MRALGRRLARLEAMKEHLDEIVSPEQLQRMAAIVLKDPLDEKLQAEAARVLAPTPADAEAVRARVREKLLGNGPHVPTGDRPQVESEARRILREKLLRPDAPAAAEPVRP